MTNPQFGFDELAAAQEQPEVLVNAADRALTSAMAGEITINFSADSDYSLQATDPADPGDEWAYATIRMTDTGPVLTGPVDVIYPDVDTLYGGPSRMRFLFSNLTAQDLTVKRAGQTGVLVEAGTSRLLHHNGTDVAEGSSAPESIIVQVALSDMSTALTSGTGKAYVRAPRAFTLTAVRASLFGVSSSGDVVIDINKNGSSVLSTKLTVDEGDKTSVGSAAAPVISDAAIAADDELTFDIDSAGTGALGAIVTLIGQVG